MCALRERMSRVVALCLVAQSGSVQSVSSAASTPKEYTNSVSNTSLATLSWLFECSSPTHSRLLHRVESLSSSILTGKKRKAYRCPQHHCSAHTQQLQPTVTTSSGSQEQ